MGFIKSIFDGDSQTEVVKEEENQFYEGEVAEKQTIVDTGTKTILLEPRAFSESQQIADHLKKGNTVVINLRRVTSDQAKRIIDFVSGAVYALDGNIQKISNSIFLIAPYNYEITNEVIKETVKEKANSVSWIK